MEEKIKIDLGHLQMTLLMPVWARALETEKENPLLIDRTAVEITRKIDFDFSKMSGNLKEINRMSWIARSKRYDLIIKDFISKNPNGIIVNIGCGLDTTYERSIVKPAFWYDLDLPDVIALRRKFLQESEKHSFIASSFLDKDWYSQIRSTDKILFISAGVFVYFEEQIIKDFIINLTNHFPDSELFFDVTSLKGLQIANNVIKASGLNSNSCFKWALSDTSIFNNWKSNLKLLNTYYTFKLPGLKMRLNDRIKGFLSDSAGVQYMVHLKQYRQNNAT
jgi:O-methyltransferase involved in polyketide biosynthesis